MDALRCMSPVVKTRLWIAALALWLGGCGFHLAGERPLPDALSSVYVEVVDPYRVSAPEVQAALVKRITSRGGLAKSHPEEAESILRLSGFGEGLEVVSIGSDGRAIEYRLTVSVRYELDDHDGHALVPGDVLRVSRDYSFSAQQILAKDVEQARLSSYLQDEMAELMLLRLEARLSHKPVPD
jgi:LPS-assembly lipoprotein